MGYNLLYDINKHYILTFVETIQIFQSNLRRKPYKPP